MLRARRCRRWSSFVVFIVVLLLSAKAFQTADARVPAPSAIQITDRYVIDVRS